MNQEIIRRYVRQPTRLPAELRAAIEREWEGRPVQLYALADLTRPPDDAGTRPLTLSETWLALGPAHVAVAREAPNGFEIRSIARACIQAVREAPGLSANTLLLLGAPDEP